ncbi:MULTISPECIES: SDR family NAD(P)-dependent oxidoreductase [unclassified Streptomyces]|uniref:SDR family NAD(P)-dependent oxidoreductase n=1 Tax=unclassified Streptomyces TaxID=2593676 RepID=UPI0034014764
MRLAGKVAIVTGGTKGLGYAIAQAYAKEGCRVVCAAREPDEGRELPPVGEGDLAYHPVDVRDPDSVEALMRGTYEAYGRLDVLVAGAGVSRAGPAEGLDAAHWTDVISTNLNGTFLSVRSALPYLVRDGGGRVITLSSALATRVAPGSSAYAASKAGIEMLTRVVAVELAGKPITVNCLSPGFIDEGMGRQLARNEAVWDYYRGKIAAGRAGRADEVADAALFLADDGSDYVNGHVLEVNGGLRW